MELARWTNSKRTERIGRRHIRSEIAYTLPEVIVAFALVGILFISLYAGFSSGFTMIKMTREDARATQILLKRMDTIRLYTWTQIPDAAYRMTNRFTTFYDPISNSGVLYDCRMSWSVPTAASGLPDTYRSRMYLITATVFWTNRLGTNVVVRRRDMQTYVARYGMQNYVYGRP